MRPGHQRRDLVRYRTCRSDKPGLTFWHAIPSGVSSEPRRCLPERFRTGLRATSTRLRVPAAKAVCNASPALSANPWAMAARRAPARRRAIFRCGLILRPGWKSRAQGSSPGSGAKRGLQAVDALRAVTLVHRRPVLAVASRQDPAQAWQNPGPQSWVPAWSPNRG